jgi:ATP-dependent DNA helicase RecG
MSISISKTNTQITREYLVRHKENQYFERKGLGEKDTKATKVAKELIGMKKANDSFLAFGSCERLVLQIMRVLKNN